MSASRGTRALLGLYPAAWRSRYGSELEDLIVQTRGERGALGTALDVARGAGRERLRAAGLTGDGVDPGERARSGTLLVLWAWVLFVIAAIGLEKASEHWLSHTPAHHRALPSAAFGVVTVAGAIGSALVLGAILAALPRLAVLLRHGGWAQIRRPILRSVVATSLAALALVALVLWARQLDVRQRNGHDLAYSAAFVACALVVAAALVSWTIAATVTARRIERPARARRLEGLAALGVVLTMATTTVAATVWWAALARSTSAGIAPLPVAETVLMAAATILGAIGTRHARAR